MTKDIEALQEAIKNNKSYTPKQRNILNLFLNIEVNGIVQLSPLEMTEMLNTSRATIYLGLSKLEKDGVIKNVTKKGKHFNTYKLNSTKLEDVLRAYKKKQNYLKKIKRIA